MANLGDFGEQDWFNLAVERKVWNGLSSSFWNDRWKGDKYFRLKYPRLYSVSNQKEAKIGEMGEPSDHGSEWRFIWRRHPFMWEEELLLNLMEDLEGMVWSEEVDGWRLDDKGDFTVKSAYSRLEGLVLREDRWWDEQKEVFKALWENKAPSKVVAFAWKYLLDRIPSKGNLALRNVLPTEGSMLCGYEGRDLAPSTSSLRFCFLGVVETYVVA